MPIIFCRRRTTAALAGGLLGFVALAGVAIPSSATGQPAFKASASADGVRIQFIVPGAPVTSDVVDGGGPTAQASLASSGDVRGFAALPYPGQAALTGPGTVAGALGASGISLPPEVPTSFPFAVSANPNAPERFFGSGPYEMRAKTTNDSAQGSASAGFPVSDSSQLSRVVSEASAVRSPDGIRAAALSRASAIQIGPLLLGELVSQAEVGLKPDGAISSQSTLHLTGVSVSGNPVGGPPDDALSLVQAVNSALGATGVRMAYAPAEATPGGIVSAGLVVTTKFPPGNGDGTIRFVLGRVSATLLTEQSATVSDVVVGTLPNGDPGASSNGEVSALPATETSDSGAIESALPQFQYDRADVDLAGSSAIPPAEWIADGLGDSQDQDQRASGATPNEQPVALSTGPAGASMPAPQFRTPYLLVGVLLAVGIFAGQFARRALKEQPA